MKRVMRTHSKDTRDNRKVYREIYRVRKIIYQGMDFIDILMMISSIIIMILDIFYMRKVEYLIYIIYGCNK